MKKLKIIFSHKIFHIFTWVFLSLLGAFIVLTIFRFFNYFEVEKINNLVSKIHSNKISINDVMGDNLPIDPGIANDKTIIGIDSNKNGIRDDVEIAIFKEYPNSAKTRAVLLQYALALQMQMTQPFIDTTIATEVVREQSRASTCLSDEISPRKDPESSRDDIGMEKIYTYINFVENKQFNTEERRNDRDVFFKNVRSYSDLEDGCDIDLTKLPN